MKIIKNWRNKRRLKWQADIRKQYRKEFDLKSKKSEFQKDYECELKLTDKDKLMDALHEHYKKEIDMIRTQTDTKWKVLLDERDAEIDKLRKEKESNREFLNKFAKMVQDFELTYTTTRIELEGAGEYMQKAQQKLLRGPGEWESFTATYKKEFPKIQEKLKEE
jgi:hypothetical protein